MNVLETCKVNEVIGVVYGDKPVERVCRVLKVRDLLTHPLSAKTLAKRPDIPRGTRLVTCQDTHGQIRAFYSGVEQTARAIPPLRAAWLHLRKKLPARKSPRVVTIKGSFSLEL